MFNYVYFASKYKSITYQSILIVLLSAALSRIHLMLSAGLSALIVACIWFYFHHLQIHKELIKATLIIIIILIIIFCYSYITLFWVLKALYIEGGISSSTTSVQHPPEWCDGSHIAPDRPPHISYRWRGDRVMQPISVWGWLGGHDGQKPMRKFGQDARVTPLLFFEGHPGIFHPKDGAFWQYSVPVTTLGC